MAEIDIVGTRRRQYRDLSLSFGLNPVTHDVITVADEEAVKRSIKTLLQTNVGEVPFFPTFGAHLRDLLFEPIDAFTTAQIDAEVRSCIEAFEPRVSILSLDVTPSIDELRYDVTLTLALLNLLEPITLTLFLKRQR